VRGAGCGLRLGRPGGGLPGRGACHTDGHGEDIVVTHVTTNLDVHQDPTLKVSGSSPCSRSQMQLWPWSKGCASFRLTHGLEQCQRAQHVSSCMGSLLRLSPTCLPSTSISVQISAVSMQTSTQSFEPSCSGPRSHSPLSRVYEGSFGPWFMSCRKTTFAEDHLPCNLDLYCNCGLSLAPRSEVR
jgi:hypothetical protein